MARQLGLFCPDVDWEAPASIPDLRGPELVGADIETCDRGLAAGVGPGWATRDGFVTGIALSRGDYSEYYPLRHPETNNIDRAHFRDRLMELFTSNTPVVFHNAAYDIGWLHTDIDLPPPRNLHDSMGAVYIIDESADSYSLARAGARFVGQGKDERGLREAAFALGLDPKRDMWQMPAKYVAEYAAQDALLCRQILDRLMPKMRKDGLWAAYRLEMDLIPMVMYMRKHGIRIDVSKAERTQEMLLRRSGQALNVLRNKFATQKIDEKSINSNKWLCAAFDAEGIKYPRTQSGTASFQTEWMTQVDHWLPNSVVRARKFREAGHKFVRTYILDHAHRGRLHAEVHQMRSNRGGTRSYRFSYANPPLQQMPARDPELGPLIRGLFLPEEGELWCANDYSQQEYRLIVHYAHACKIFGVDRALELYRSEPETDFHSMVAKLTGLPRKPAKDANFAKAFGAGIAQFARMTNKTKDEAKVIMEQYDHSMPFVRLLSEHCQATAARRGYVRLLDGARCRFHRWEPRDWDARKAFGPPRGQTHARQRLEDCGQTGAVLQRAYTHKAMNRLIQGSAARQTKLAMRACFQEGLLPLLQMHDELGFSVTAQDQGRRAAELMRDVVQLSVPMVVDSEYGANWGDATHSWEKSAHIPS